jgi:threonine dehydratase
LASLLAAIAEAGANVTSVQHDRRSARAGVGRTEVNLVLETRGFEHVQAVQQAIREAGWEIAS